ncbi:MAG: acyl-CoA reductase, partial [Pseudomonadota bacterium]
MKNNHYLFGDWCQLDDFSVVIDKIRSFSQNILASPFDPSLLFNALEKTAKELSVSEIDAETRAFLAVDYWQEKVLRELGTFDFLEFRRSHFDKARFEAYQPLGILLHITPGNFALAGLGPVLEGLVTGNVNLLKQSSRAVDNAHEILTTILNNDSTGQLKKRVAILQLSSKEEEKMKLLYRLADGIAVWGGDQTIAAVKKAAPLHVRIIPWGHKISMAYVTKELMNDNQSLASLARDCVALEQQACSSPQIIYGETSGWSDLGDFARKFLWILQAESLKIAPSELTVQEQAEITNNEELIRLESIEGQSLLLKGEHCRLLVENDSQ